MNRFGKASLSFFKSHDLSNKLCYIHSSSQNPRALISRPWVRPTHLQVVAQAYGSLLSSSSQFILALLLGCLF